MDSKSEWFESVIPIYVPSVVGAGRNIGTSNYAVLSVQNQEDKVLSKSNAYSHDQ